MNKWESIERTFVIPALFIFVLDNSAAAYVQLRFRR